MALFPDPTERRRVYAVSGLIYCNPFLAERIELERTVLGPAFDEAAADWNRHPDWGPETANLVQLRALARELAEATRGRLEAGHAASDADRELYDDLVWFALYMRHGPALDRAADACADGRTPRLDAVWDALVADARRFAVGGAFAHDDAALAHGLAVLLQIRRAFHNVFDAILGVSEPAARLRAAVWQSIFTHDMRRYHRVVYERMVDLPTLVTGPSGTGKELVARAVGNSRYVPFDPQAKRLAGTTDFRALNLSALSETLIESELFGHKRGAFTGAVGDREGWLEACTELGSVFLDEIGEVSPSIQVKLLRVLEERSFCRVGETEDRAFRGKIVAATNRDLAAEMRAGRFRTDLYYRLCADTIETPSLAARLRASADERRQLVTFLARRLVGDEAEGLADEVEAWIDAELGTDYAWPGNVRELEQCVRQVLIRREYRPAGRSPADGADDPYAELAEAMRDHRLTAAELERRYCRLVYAATRSYTGAARKLGLDRRTVVARVSRALDG